MNFDEEFLTQFGDKYKDLQLQSVMVKKSDGVCTITFLSPSTAKELSDEQKQEIVEFLKERLALEHLSLKVKFRRAYVEEKLIRKAIVEFFANKYKLISAYLHDESFVIEISPIDVLVKIVVSARLENFFLEHKITAELAKFLKDNFLAEFVVTLEISEEIVDEVDIESVEIKATYKPVKRYSVEIIKDCIGSGIQPKPEYISNIKSPKTGVIVAGFISKLTRHDFVRKTGTKAGTEGVFYTFEVEDEKGKIDCIIFCSKSKLKEMDALEDFMYMLLHGDVEKNKFSGKLTLKVDKMALASKVIEVEEAPQPKKTISSDVVVKVEKLTTLSQDDMFGSKVEYNDNIKDKSIVVFDLETTGLDVDNDQITEIGAVKIVDGEIKEKFSTLVKPTIEISREVTKVTGITNEMVADAPGIEYVIRDFYEFTRGCIVCGHNVIGFDWRFIKRYGQENGYNFDNETIDTLLLARKSGLKVTNYKLGTIVKYLGLTLEGAHRAWNDAYATAQVLLKISEK